jgi:MoaA/NifB/PqqE/SkfB family radical SAM enzyme
VEILRFGPHAKHKALVLSWLSFGGFMDFPGYLSLTVTNACNLRCRMCAQWSEEGYMRAGREHRRPTMSLADWKRLVDEAKDHGIGMVLIRGGEPFLLPGIVELLDHIAERGLFASIDSNGTRLAEYADDLVRIGHVHVTVSVDGPAEIHDAVRATPGCFEQIAEGLARLKEAEQRRGASISKSITFTISPWSLRGLGSMPDVARSLGVQALCIVPYFYVPEALGRAYEQELKQEMGSAAFSWRGFHHETSGVDFELLRTELRAYRANLGTISDYPYLPLSEEEYRLWFKDPVAPVFMAECPNVERLIDIQPTGEANFCVDFPDYSLGNVHDATIEELWNGERARRFRERRRKQPFSACHRCGAKYVGLARD